MHLDLPTLFATTVIITLLIGGLFLFSWNQARGTRALLLWGVAHLCGGTAAALICLRTIVPDALSIGLANALMLTAYGLIWTGLRCFEGRPANYRAALAGSLIWIGACTLPAFYASLPMRVALASGLASTYCALGARECWRGRSEALPSRPVVTALMGAYAFVYAARIPATILAPVQGGANALAAPWVPILCLTAILLTIALAYLLVALTKERAEREQRIAAETDPLTGIANRRAFGGQAQALLSDPAVPAALLLFDLDHFKGINDRYGHGVGDAVLAGFSQFVLSMLPRGATFGRLGGEEFACLAPGLDADAAHRMAEGLRAGLARLSVEGYPELAIRMSVGVAVRRAGAPADLDGLAREADAALYRAKSNGRDRIEMARPPHALLTAA